MALGRTCPNSDDKTKITLRWTSDGKQKKRMPKRDLEQNGLSEMKEMEKTRKEIEKIHRTETQDRQLWRGLVMGLCADARYEEDK